MVNIENLFSDERFEKRLVMNSEDFDCNFDDHFESLLFRNGLCHTTTLQYGTYGS